MTRTGAPHVYLDLTHLNGEFLSGRFPRIYETCRRHGYDFTAQPVPVAPAAHYAMGGVRTDLNGATNIPGLFAAGEVACTGVHGANRLASNSLLEGVVFGARAGRAMRELAGRPVSTDGRMSRCPMPLATGEEVRQAAWDYCGVVRSGAGLEELVRRLGRYGAPSATHLRPEDAELRNMHLVALLIARCALARLESRGAHFRRDCPGKREEFAKHSLVSKDADVTFS
jgi:L-aspartate oxidase